MPSLTPQGLNARFGARSPLAQASIRSLWQAFNQSDQGPDSDYARWLDQFTPYAPRDIPAQLLTKAYAFPPDAAPQPQIFVLQTYYALLIRMLAARYLGQMRPVTAATDLEGLLRAIESGAFFRDAGVLGFSSGDAFNWYLQHWGTALHETCQALWDGLDSFTLQDSPYPDALKALYENLMPRRLRHSLGEYYTPDWLAEHVLDRLGYQGDGRLLDPGCGSGTFLVMALRRAIARQGHAAALEQIAGIEINSLAVLSARTNLLLSLGAVLQSDQTLQLPIHQADALCDPPDLGHFDTIAGNPPWVNWESLPDAQRMATRADWAHYGLFASKGMDVILGQGKKDLSMLFTYASADRYLRVGGRLGFIITQSVIKTSGAGAGFRRWRLPDGTALGVQQVDDLSHVAPFPGASTRPIVLILEKGQPTQYPVPYTLWHKRDEPEEHVAEPIDTADPFSAWLDVRPTVLPVLRSLLGPADYRAHAGAYTGGANAVYWLDVLAQDGPLLRIRNIIKGAHKAVPQVEAWVEAECVYPLLRGRDVRRWQAQPGASILMVQDPRTRRGYDTELMATHYPHTLAYLARFEALLRRRAAYKRYFRPEMPYYSMFDVGPYTFAPHKVVWQGLGENRMRAAVISQQDGKAIISNQAMHPFIAVETAREAHYLAACLNSAPFEFAVLSHTQVGGKSFAQPGILNMLRLPRFQAGLHSHESMADLSEAAHNAPAETIPVIEAALHQQSAPVWGLSAGDVGEILAALQALR